MIFSDVVCFLASLFGRFVLPLALLFAWPLTCFCSCIQIQKSYWGVLKQIQDKG